MAISQATYIWMDGSSPTQKLRSKRRVLQLQDLNNITTDQFPEWGYDAHPLIKRTVTFQI